MSRSDDDGWVDRKQGNYAEVLRCDPLRSEGADPRVAIARVCVVQLGFGFSFKIDFTDQGKTCCAFLLLL